MSAIHNILGITIWITALTILGTSLDVGPLLEEAEERIRPEYTTDLETKLRKELFTGYEVLQRPAKHVDVNMSLTLLTVNELNIKDQVLSLSGYLTVQWMDGRLMWSNTSSTAEDYSNVPFLFSTETYVWRPAIIIENSVEDISVISDENIPMRMQSNGEITWNPSGIYKVSCEPDITYYPMDYQHCTIIVTTWSYTSAEISLHFSKDPINLDFYSENGEWELQSTSHAVGNDKSRGGQSFSSLDFQIALRRRPLFHILNTLFPVTLMAILIAMVFRLPPDSGEKIGFSLTVLLAYAVYLTLISDNIPSTSMTVCYLTIYLALTLALGTISVICTIIVLEVHFHTEQDKIPSWLIGLSRDCMARIICWNKKPCCSGRRQVKPEKEKAFTKLYVKEKPPIPLDDCVSMSEEKEDEGKITWQDIAIILDKFFFASYMLIILMSSLVLWTVVLVQYTSH